MDTFIRFLFEFMSVLFKGVGMIFGGIFKGIIQLFNFQDYWNVVEFYRKDFSGAEWIFVVIAILGVKS